MDEQSAAKIQAAMRLLQEVLEADASEKRRAPSPSGGTDDEILTVKEVMALYKVSRGWIQKHLDELPALRSGSGQRRMIRFQRSALEDWWSAELWRQDLTEQVESAIKAGDAARAEALARELAEHEAKGKQP